MFDDSSKFDMKVRREPVTGLQMSQQLLSGRTSQSVALHFLTEKLFLLQQFSRPSVVVNSSGPVVTHENVDGLLDLHVEKKNKHDTFWQSFKIKAKEKA